jgi:hypothetical protein
MAARPANRPRSAELEPALRWRRPHPIGGSRIGPDGDEHPEPRRHRQIKTTAASQEPPTEERDQRKHPLQNRAETYEHDQQLKKIC